jgi:aromatic-amino-acid transaminase
MVRFNMQHLIPSHGSRPADDPIFALNREATQRRAKGDAIINATVGALLDDDNKLAVLPTAAKILQEVPRDEWAAYAPIAGTPEFAKAVTQDLFASAPELAEIATAVATPGGSGALRHAIANYLEPGQALLTTNFYWGPYQTLADEADRKVETFAMFGADGALDIASFDAALTKQIKAQGRALIFLNDPCHNPTGYSMRTEEWRKIADVVRKHGKTSPVTLLVDAAYSAYGRSDRAAMLREVAPVAEDACLLFAWSASKTFTHYGLRVGALVACVKDSDERKRTHAALSYSSRGTWSNCTRGGLWAITKLLTDPTLARACDDERAALTKLLFARVDAFNAHAKGKLKYPRYEGGFFVTVFTDHGEAKAAQLRERGVFVVPLTSDLGDALRIGLCSVAEKDIPRLVEELIRVC